MLRKTLTIICITILFNAASFAGSVKGVTASISPENGEKTVYLTLDACGSEKGSGYDAALIEFLSAGNIPAALFLSGTWIDRNTKTVSELSENPLFKIENHGLAHRPASVKGLTVFGIKGTSSKEELINEVVKNSEKIESLTEKKPLWFRSGTGYYDREAIDIITGELGIMIAGFSLSCDEGATLSADKVFEKAMQARSGYIIVAHMNHPGSGTFEGLKRAITELISEGYEFRPLPDK